VKIKQLATSILSASLLLGAAFAVHAQDDNRNRVAKGNNLGCAGYIQKAPVNTRFEVVGAEEEQEQHVYAQGEYIYLNFGANTGVKENDRYSVIRPRGRFRSPFSSKGDLGIYIQEVGAVRVVRVKQEVSVALVENSCETILLGDLLVPQQTKIAPQRRQHQPLDRFSDPNGKANGRIVLARDGREALARDQIVYLDLGAEDNVKAGDYLTIYRPLGTGNLTRITDVEVVRPEDMGFESRRYRGGKFSNQAMRKKGSDAEGRMTTTKDVKSRRPKMPRKVVGEVVIISVNERTATAVITQNAQEIHTGDYVEVQ
jgi:hypothetical protein